MSIKKYIDYTILCTIQVPDPRREEAMVRIRWVTPIFRFRISLTSPQKKRDEGTRLFGKNDDSQSREVAAIYVPLVSVIMSKVDSFKAGDVVETAYGVGVIVENRPDDDVFFAVRLWRQPGKSVATAALAYLQRNAVSCIGHRICLTTWNPRSLRSTGRLFLSFSQTDSAETSGRSWNGHEDGQTRNNRHGR